MRIVSVQVGRPRTVTWRGEPVRTSIFKEPVAGPVAVRRHNLAGDEPADLSVHGGAEKAVYAYPAEHYAYWRATLPGVALPWGAFGENLTTAGLVESALPVGARLRIGSAELQVTQQRNPCSKLGLRFGDPGMVKRFVESGRPGFYLAVVREGTLAAGDAIEPVVSEPGGVTVAEATRAYLGDDSDPDLLRRAIATSALPARWRERFRARLAGAHAGRPR